MKKAAPTELAPQKIVQAKEVKSQVDKLPPGSVAKTAPAQAGVVKGISIEASDADTTGDTHGLVPKASDTDTTKEDQTSCTERKCIAPCTCEMHRAMYNCTCEMQRNLFTAL